jgi:hypothetical protein
VGVLTVFDQIRAFFRKKPEKPAKKREAQRSPAFQSGAKKPLKIVIFRLPYLKAEIGNLLNPWFSHPSFSRNIAVFIP